MGSYDDELTDDQRSWLRERAEVQRRRWRIHAFWRGVWDGFTCIKYIFVKSEQSKW